MKKNTGLATLLFLLLFVINWSCQTAPTKVDSAYLTEVEDWRTERIDALTTPTGWLSLAGLFWLKEGPNSFGASNENSMVYPAKASAKMGQFVLAADSVWLEAEEGVGIKANGEVTDKIGLTGVTEPVIMEYENLSWFLLKRGGKYGIRLRDSLHEARAHFETIEHYPVDPIARIPAKLRAFEKPETLLMRNVLEMDIPYPTEGKLVFEWEGQEQAITVLDGGADEYFLIFADETTGEETYPSGRYLYAPKADENGDTYIDFNKAYNPPCAFTEYATCLLPPAENRLAVAIRFGEKNYGTH